MLCDISWAGMVYSFLLACRPKKETLHGTESILLCIVQTPKLEKQLKDDKNHLCVVPMQQENLPGMTGEKLF